MKISIKILYAIQITALLICILAMILGLKFEPLGYCVVGIPTVFFIVFIILKYFDKVKN